MSELTTHRTLALRHTIGEQPEVAFLAALHALCLKVFYPYALDTCLELDLKIVSFSAQARGLSETVPAKAIGDRHQAWISALPREATGLWNALSAMDEATRFRLFAHCIGSSLNAVHEPYNRRPRALTHADRLAEAVRLDMAAAGWKPTVDTYLGRVTKARILQAVRESKGQQAAQRIEHLKKGEMADQAQALLAGSGWVPEPLRAPGQPVSPTSDTSTTEGTTTDADEAEPEPAADTWPVAEE